MHPETKAAANASLERKTTDNLSFVSATSEASGKDERTIRRAAARGEALGDDISAVVGTSLDKGVELDALSKMPVDERRTLIQRAKAGEAVSARKEPKVAADPLPGALAQEAAAIARRKAIYEALHPETKEEAFKGNQHTGGRQFGDEHADRFTAATAAATGKAERNIQRAASRGEALGDDLREIAGGVGVAGCMCQIVAA